MSFDPNTPLTARPHLEAAVAGRGGEAEAEAADHCAEEPRARLPLVEWANAPQRQGGGRWQPRLRPDTRHCPHDPGDLQL